jgi:hypothetical protein
MHYVLMMIDDVIEEHLNLFSPLSRYAFVPLRLWPLSVEINEPPVLFAIVPDVVPSVSPDDVKVDSG